MKVLFVWPEYRRSGYKSIGLSILSAILANKGHQCILFDTSIYDIPIPGRDNDIETAEAIQLYPKTKLPDVAKKRINKNFVAAFNECIDNFEPDLIAFSTTSLAYILVRKLIENINPEKRPSIAIGGVHTLSTTAEILDSYLFDYICFGEGEEALPSIIEHCQGKRNASDIPNVFVREEDTYVRNAPSPFIGDLDSLPHLNWDIFDEHHFWRPYQGTAYRTGDYISSRGCPFRCSYCFYDKFHDFYHGLPKVRYLSADRVVSEMKELSDKYDLHFWKFHDSDFLLRSENKFGELIELYKSKINLPYVCNANANNVNDEKIKILSESNCKSISIGVESGSERIRREVLNKHLSNDAIVSAVRIIKEHGIRVSTFNMLGLPEETEKDIRETIKLNRSAKPDLADFNFFYPFKGTKLGDLCFELGYAKEESEKLINFRMQSILEMPQITKEKLIGLHRTFHLYMKLPEWLDPVIKLAENDDIAGNTVYEALIRVINEKT